MLQNQKNLLKLIQRSLGHLEVLIKQKQITEYLSALCYTANLLTKYCQTLPKKLSQKDKFEQRKLFQKYYSFLKFIEQKDFTILKKNQIGILDELYNYVNQQQFQKFLREDIENIKNSHRKTYQAVNNEENQVIFASNHSFSVPKQDIEDGLKHSKVKKERNSLQQIQAVSTHSNDHGVLDQLWQKIQYAYGQHNIDQAYAKSQQYRQKVDSIQKIPVQRQKLMQTIDLEYKTMTEFYQQFEQQGWIKDKTEKGISLEYKLFEQQKQIAIRIHAECDIGIQQFIAIISQIDLMEQYVPFCYDSRELKVISRNQKIGTSKIYIPLLTDRETYFYAAGYNRITSHGSIFLFSKTINEDLLYQKKYEFNVPKESDYVRLQYKFFIIQYVPLSRTRAKIRLASKVDMKLNFLPQFILNKSARTFAFDYFKNILKKTANFKGSPWQKKMIQHPDLYKFFRQKIDEYMK